MTAFITRMGTGVAGTISRMDARVAEPIQYAVSAPAFGAPVKPTGSGFVGAEPAGSVYGFAIREYPSQSTTDALGAGSATLGDVGDVLRQGYMIVQLRDTGAVRDGIAYVRVANATGLKPFGGVEATNSADVIDSGWRFTSVEGADGLVEISKL